jgi:TPR repeat protein
MTAGKGGNMKWHRAHVGSDWPLVALASAVLVVAAAAPSVLFAASAGIHDCDRLAGAPGDPGRVTEGVATEKIDGSAAIAACSKAVAEAPTVARFHFEYGRALDSAKRGQEAVAQYRIAAEQNYSSAQNNLGNAYTNGTGVAQDYAEAVRWYRKAAEQDNPMAQTNLGMMYANGRGVPQDQAEAVRWYRKAAEQGLSVAQSSLANAYANGRGVPQDYAQAERWYRKAIEQNSASAEVGLGYLYETGHGVPQDDAEAVRWYRQAAEQGHTQGQTNLATMYANGRGVPRDMAEAERWMRAAAGKGDARATKWLAVHASGTAPAVTPPANASPAGIHECDRLASSPTDPGRVSEGVPHEMMDVPAAIAACSKAVAENPAMGRFHFEYGRALTTAKRDQEAVAQYRIGAEQGYASAQNDLGVAYNRGIGAPQDYAEAVRWYRKAAEQGHPVAQTNLGLHYAEGRGVSQDHAEAVRWYRKAAEQGHAPAQTRLGNAYANGLGVPKDGAEAERLMRLAAGHGDANAEKWLAEHGSTPATAAPSPANPSKSVPVASAPASPAPPKPSAPSSPAVAPTSAPAPSPPPAANTAHVIPPFAGYAVAKMCDPSVPDPPGAPWQGSAGKDSGAVVPASAVGRYTTALRHTMQGLQVLYGRLSAAEQKTFDALWAPYFDHPTGDALAYFERLNPLLDQAIATLATLDGLMPQAGEGFTAALLVSALPSSAATSVATAVFRELKAQRAKLDQLIGQITALGNPPNPLAAKCAAQARHRKAVGGVSEMWSLLMKTNVVGIRAADDKTNTEWRAGNRYAGALNAPKTEIRWQPPKFTFAWLQPQFADPCTPWKAGESNVPPDCAGSDESHHWEGTGELSADGMSVVAIHAIRTTRHCGVEISKATQDCINNNIWLPKNKQIDCLADPKTRIPHILEDVKHFDFDRTSISLYQDKPVTIGDKTRLVYATPKSLDLKANEWPSGALSIEFRNYTPRDDQDLLLAIYNIGRIAAAKQPSTSAQSGKQTTGPAPAPPATKDQAGKSAAAADDPEAKAIAEAYEAHQKYAADFRRQGQSLLDQAAQEKDPRKRDDLEGQARGKFIMASAEEDIANSQKTGVIIHTHTQWHDEELKKDEAATKKEFAVFDAEKKLIAGVPKMGAMLQGTEGEQYGQQLQQRIGDAIHSDDPLGKLQAISDQTRDKVVAQGERQMAAERATVETWDNRVWVAEHVESGAGTAITLAALWEPVAMESLAVGFSTAVGLAEEGPAGAVKSIARGVSGKLGPTIGASVDVLISAYEGANAIDPDTGKPAGAWGALTNAGIAAATNVAFHALGEEIRIAKSSIAQEEAIAARLRQGQGAPGVAKVARAGDGRVGDYGVTSSAQRYQEELAAGTTPEQQDAAMRAAKARQAANTALASQAKGGTGVAAVARAGSGGDLKEYDFKSSEQRYQEDLAAAKSPDEQKAVNARHAVQAERAAMKQEQQQALERAEERVRNGEDPSTVKRDYDQAMAAVDLKYQGRDTRNQVHEEVMKKLGFNPSFDEKNPDLKPTGGKAKTAASDLDFEPQGATPSEAYQKGRRYAEAMQSPPYSHNVYEYGDRWVDTTSDTTIWKPGFNGDKPGSSSFEAEAMFGSLPGSDKFGTKGGVEWTGKPSVPPNDPLGVVLANLGKATGAGLGTARPKDLHVIGKSADKVLGPGMPGVEIDAKLRQQLTDLRNHMTPEQAGVLTLGASDAVKQKEQQAFLDKIQDLMVRSYRAAKATSLEKTSVLERQADAASSPKDAAELRIRAAAYRASNDAALATIGSVAPELAGKMAATTLPPAAAPVDGVKTGKPGELLKTLEQARVVDDTPPSPFVSGDPYFRDLGDRCKQAATELDGRIKAAKPGSDEAKYLVELKTAMELGSTNPPAALQQVRSLSGYELPVVLNDLGIASKGK